MIFSRCSDVSARWPSSPVPANFKSTGADAVGQYPKSNVPEHSDGILESIIIPHPQAGTIPHRVLTLYGSGADEGTEYASHL